MKPDRKRVPDWDRVKKIFEEAAQRPPEERAKVLAETCGSDPELLREVQSLLESVCDLTAIEDIVANAGCAVNPSRGGESSPEPSRAGQVFGAYRLVHLIDSGGMGAVYLGVRADDAYEMRVAVKLIKGAMVSPGNLARFMRERQALAHLDHPNIARLLDGGASEDGTPYLVMEFVDGDRIDVWCDERELGIRERLVLFLSVCDAVLHAHRNLIVHRDIKPSNVLVTGEGVPKLLDFGIAKVLDEEATATTRQTFTPEYASPEQLLGKPVTTATDVYSLGVLLYELLTGSRPFHSGSKPSHLLAQEVCEHEPTRPSSRCIRPYSGLTAAEIGKRRGLAPQRLRRRLAGDLDNVVLKALRKEPERRYASVDRLAMDIRCHLEGRPVSARPDTLVYRMAKYVRRNRAAIAGASIALAFALYGLVSSQSSLAREREMARNLSDVNWEYVTTLLENPLLEDTPSYAALIEYLDEVASFALEAEHANSEVEVVRLKGLLAKFGSLGFQPKGRAMWSRILEIAQDNGDELLMADALHGLSRRDECLAIRRRLLEEPHALIAKCLQAHAGDAHSGQEYVAAKEFFRQAREMLLALGDEADLSDLAVYHSSEASFLLETGQPALSIERSDAAVGYARQLGNPKKLLNVLNTHSFILHDLGRYDEARRDMQELAGLSKAVFPGDHPEAIMLLVNHALLLKDMGLLDEAEERLPTVLDLPAGLRRSEVARVIRMSRAKLNADRARWRAAEEEILRSMEMSRRDRGFGEDHVSILKQNTLRCRALIHQGRAEEAARQLEQVVEAWSGKVGYERWERHKSCTVLGHAYARLGRFEEAEEILLEHVPPLVSDRGEHHYRSAQALYRLVDLYERWGREEEAAIYRAKITETARQHSIVRVTVLPLLEASTPKER